MFSPPEKDPRGEMLGDWNGEFITEKDWAKTLSKWADWRLLLVPQLLLLRVDGWKMDREVDPCCCCEGVAGKGG